MSDKAAEKFIKLAKWLTEPCHILPRANALSYIADLNDQLELCSLHSYTDESQLLFYYNLIRGAEIVGNINSGMASEEKVSSKSTLGKKRLENEYEAKDDQEKTRILDPECTEFSFSHAAFPIQFRRMSELAACTETAHFKR
ncbi:hypothetical protein J6590_064594 [Homalodisca vitripennis]|nr:hypothetical protein J6590_064594 [Homalodisca vitripennis]